MNIPPTVKYSEEIAEFTASQLLDTSFTDHGNTSEKGQEITINVDLTDRNEPIEEGNSGKNTEKEGNEAKESGKSKEEMLRDFIHAQ